MIVYLELSFHAGRKSVRQSRLKIGLWIQQWYYPNILLDLHFQDAMRIVLGKNIVLVSLSPLGGKKNCNFVGIFLEVQNQSRKMFSHKVLYIYCSELSECFDQCLQINNKIISSIFSKKWFIWGVGVYFSGSMSETWLRQGPFITTLSLCVVGQKKRWG